MPVSAEGVHPFAVTAKNEIMQKIKLLARRQASTKLFTLTFERPEGFTFKAGQFARLGLPSTDPAVAEPIIRAYSIASAPEADHLEFFITAVEGGALSPRLAALQPGAEVFLDGEAQGALTPERVPGGETLWLMATGSGLSPFASMIRSEAVWQQWQDIVLVESVRTFDEAVLARELVAAMPEDRRPQLLIATTRESDPARQGDLAGRIPALITSNELERVSGRTISAEKSRLLLCGNPGFIADTRAALKERGIVSPRFGRPGQLVVENFW